MNVQVARKLFTVREYDRFIEAGVLTEDDRIELIDGEVLEMSPIGSRHAACVARLTRMFSALDEEIIVWVQSPIQAGDYSEPEPDVVILAFRDDFYEMSRPVPEDIYLLIEVADSSLPYDRQIKVPLYAKTGVPETWVVDVEGEAIYVHRNLVKGIYQETFTVGQGETLSPAAFPDLEFEFAKIL